MPKKLEISGILRYNHVMKNDMNETKNYENIIKTKDKKIAELEALVAFYEEQTRLAKHRQYGVSSEKSPLPEQLGLFDEAENEADNKAKEPEIDQIIYTRKKREGKRNEDLSKLPVEVIEYTHPASEQECPECGKPMHVMSTEVRKELTIIPAQVKVTEHHQHIYACRACEKHGETTPIVKAKAPEPVIKNSLASPSAVAHIMTQKYVNAVPLYRQEQGFLREDIAISRQTMANWMIKCAEDWLRPIYEMMKSDLLSHSVLHADETVVQVLKEAGKKARTESYMWLYRTSGDSPHPIVLYEYQPTRSSAHPKRFLSGYKGYLHTDGYAGYHNLSPDMVVVGCWAHARRKFDEALKASPPEAKVDSAAKTGLDYCNQLFSLEKDYIDLSFDSRYNMRIKESLPVAEAFFAWANSVNAIPKSAIGKAIDYLINQWPYLKSVYLDGRLELSNNRAERSIKPFVIGRKNWLFSNTVKGADSSAVIYSVIETAKENLLHPFLYLEYLFWKIPNATSLELSSFLPWSTDVQVACRVK